MVKPAFSDFELPVTDKDTFKGADPDTRMLYLFDLQMVSLENQRKIFVALELRNKEEEHARKKNTYIAGITGLIGGIAAVFSSKILKL